MHKMSEVAEMTDDVEMKDEVKKFYSGSNQDDPIRTLVINNLDYKLAQGELQRELSQNYVADSLTPKDGKGKVLVPYRVLTLEQGVLGVSADATLAVRRDEQGNVFYDQGKV